MEESIVFNVFNICLMHNITMSAIRDEKNLGGDVGNANNNNNDSNFSNTADDRSKRGLGEFQTRDLSNTEEQQVESFKDIASTIREYAVMARETSKALRESGAIPELVVAVREIASVVRDIAAEVKETSRELKESGVTNEIASTVRQTVDLSKETVQMAKETASSAKERYQSEQPATSSTSSPSKRKQGLTTA
jgi:hypothetical protein